MFNLFLLENSSGRSRTLVHQGQHDRSQRRQRSSPVRVLPSRRRKKSGSSYAGKCDESLSLSFFTNLYKSQGQRLTWTRWNKSYYYYYNFKFFYFNFSLKKLLKFLLKITSPTLTPGWPTGWPGKMIWQKSFTGERSNSGQRWINHRFFQYIRKKLSWLCKYTIEK